jgi:hypothetical protein
MNLSNLFIFRRLSPHWTLILQVHISGQYWYCLLSPPDVRLLLWLKDQLLSKDIYTFDNFHDYLYVSWRCSLTTYFLFENVTIFFWQISMMIHIQCVVYHCSYLNWMWCNSSCGFVWTPKIHARPPIQINCRSFRQILSKMCLASWNMWQLIWITGTVKVAIFIWMF